MAMSLIADEEDYENSDAEQVEPDLRVIRLKKRRCERLHAAVICVYLHV